MGAPVGKPLITANQVTFARLALLPFGSWMMYQGLQGLWVALVFMTIVGSTDFVDGWLARKYGPTVLGSLMDPIADKVFVAAIFIPAVDLGWLPWYLVALIFTREYLVTAMRTVYERRQVSLKTMYLAKVKTWFQMCGVAVLFLLHAVQTPRYLTYILGSLALSPVVGGVVFYLVRRQRWRGSFWFAICFGALWASFEIWGARHVGVGVGWAIFAITWASGGAYAAGLRELPGTGRVDGGDVARVFGALTLPVLALWAVSFGAAPSWPVIIALAQEFAGGGLDNLLAHGRTLPSTFGWTARVVPQAILLGAAAWAAASGRRELVGWLFYATAGVTTISAAILFFRQRRAYLGEAEQLAP